MCLLSVTLSSYTQSDIEMMRNNTDWIVGKGVADDEYQADKLAISDLLSQISIEVESSFENLLTEENSNVREFCSSSLKTYSNTRLQGAQKSIFETKAGYIVYRYIRKTDKNRIFEDRQTMVYSYLTDGLTAESELRICDALQNYYWALILLRTLPDWSNISCSIEGTNQVLITFIPNRIRKIFSLIQISINDIRYDKTDKMTLVEIGVMYDNKPVQNLDLVYYSGASWSEPLSITNGKGLLEFYCNKDDIPTSLGINIIYNSKEKSSFNPELTRIIEDVILPVFSECKIKMTMTDIKTSKKFEPKIKIENPVSLNDEVQDNERSDINYQFYLDKANRIYQAINRKDYKKLDLECNDNGKMYVQRILQYGNSRPVSQNFTVKCEKYGDETIVRGFPVQFSFPQSGRKFNEQLAFTFDKTGNLDKVNFALSDQAISDILGSVRVSDVEKTQILHFIEDYKTAYCLKDIGFIEKVFSDNALIIVGSMLYDDPSTNLDDIYMKLGKKWKATQYSKQEYLSNLRKLFATNEFVNIRFEDNYLSRNNNPSSKVFGIQIHQYYYSQHYADEGYLFIMFDLEDIINPKILVRTWQPEKNPDGSIYGLKDFFFTE